MSNSSEIDIINTLNGLTPYLNRYLSIGILLFGSIGNLLNCLTLSQPVLRTNPCAVLFLASSIASLITLISGVGVRLLAGWSLDLTDKVAWLCKLRIFSLFTSRTVASWLIVLATIDRWLSSATDVNRRQKSTLKNAVRGMIASIFLSILVYAQIFYCYDANLTNAPLKCYGISTTCRLLIDFEFVTISILLPSTLMFIFGLMTILNVRKSALRRIQPAPTLTLPDGRKKSKKLNNHLMFMLFLQVIFLTLFSLPQAIQNLYSNLTRFQVKSPLHTAINNFIFNICLLLTYVTNGMPFYIYTLGGGSTFRKALINALRDFIQKMTCKQS